MMGSLCERAPEVYEYTKMSRTTLCPWGMSSDNGKAQNSGVTLISGDWWVLSKSADIEEVP